jgi:hypothetical protein
MAASKALISRLSIATTDASFLYLKVTIILLKKYIITERLGLFFC